MSQYAIGSSGLDDSFMIPQGSSNFASKVTTFFPIFRDQMNVNEEGWSYAAFLFELSLATTASTIVSGKRPRSEISNIESNRINLGAVAERAKLKSYILLGCLVILIQALPAHWVWDKRGFFYKLGVVDFAGCSAVRQSIRQDVAQTKLDSGPYGWRNHRTNRNSLFETSAEKV